MQEDKVKLLESLRLVANGLKENDNAVRTNLKSYQRKAGKLYMDHMQRKESLQDTDFKNIVYILKYK